VPELIIKSPAILVARELNAFAINPKHSHLTQEIINEIHSQGFEIHTWTVNKKIESKNSFLGKWMGLSPNFQTD
jgi:glycerophosphoryl diester phosphodiesterase